MLKIENLTKVYGKIVAVSNLSLELNKGEIFGFIGPNGAGKSTTIKCVLGFLNFKQGKIIINGKEFNKRDVKTTSMIGYLPSEVFLYDDLTGEEIINYSKKFYNNIDEEYLSSLIKRLNFEPNKKIESYSFGNRKKLGIILCLMHNPELIIMDEATSGLDPLIQEEFYKILIEEKEKGKTIFFSSHNLSEVKKICDRIGIIKEGKLLLLDELEKITNASGQVVSIYFDKLEIEKITQKIIYKDKNMIKFIFNGESKDLIKLLSKLKINKFLVEEPSIEDIFMHFYK